MSTPSRLTIALGLLAFAAAVPAFVGFWLVLLSDLSLPPV